MGVYIDQYCIFIFFTSFWQISIEFLYKMYYLLFIKVAFK